MCLVLYTGYHVYVIVFNYYYLCMFQYNYYFLFRYLFFFFFFFSSRRRHTRYWRDWSSDVCSSDLVLATTLSLVVIFLPVSFMSSISGRFLYQFGITAAVAIMVSLLVSFTLTPMMSSRLLRAEDAAGHGDPREGPGGRPGSRGGFYGHIDRAYTWLLVFAMRHRLAVSALAVLVVASSVPLYRAVRQEFIPSNVDEAEFEGNVNAPEGTNLPTMNETMQAVEQDIMKTPGVRLVLATAGGGFLGGVGQGDLYVRIAPHEERTLSFGRLWRETLNGTPLQAFRG